MEQAVGAAAGRINGKYGDVAWTPIRYLNRTYSRPALAGLFRSARAALVTPLRDGMNLVAKEYVAAQDAGRSRRAHPVALCRQRRGMLGRAAGQSLRSGLGRSAIARALDMPLAERRERHQATFATLARNPISRWSTQFLHSLGPSAATAAIPLEPRGASQFQGGGFKPWMRRILDVQQ